MTGDDNLNDRGGWVFPGRARSVVLGLLAPAVAWAGLQAFPNAEVEWFARGTGLLAALLSGGSLERVDEGWLLGGSFQPVVVSAACSATHYYLTNVALLAWRLAPGRFSAPAVTGLAIAGAFPLVFFVNALRVIVVMHAHHWVIPQLPEAYGPFLHLLAGVAVFLPALVGLNLALEFYGNTRRPAR
jgi:exosortase/archaeosortase family protein